MAVAKKEIVSKRYTNRKPQSVTSGAFCRLVVTVVSVEPFADVGANYTSRNGNQERNYQLQAAHPLSVARLGATTDKVYHNFFNLGILHSGVAYDIMPIGEKMK